MAWARYRPLVALDAASVSGGRLARGLGGFRLENVVRLELPAGALVPSPMGPNLLEPERVRTSLARLLDSLGGGREQATLVLPDGLAWFIRLGVPAAAILMPLGFFLSVPSPSAVKPNGMIRLVYAGAVLLAVLVLTLGVGLVRAGIQ